MSSPRRRKAFAELCLGFFGLVLGMLQWRTVQAHTGHRVLAWTGLGIILLVAGVFLWSSVALLTKRPPREHQD